MELLRHDMQALFEQLGLPGDPRAVEDFIVAHRPVPSEIRLAEAAFWSSGQAAFLRDEIEEDADWAEIIDALDSALRARQEGPH